jgi:hypothetical protein
MLFTFPFLSFSRDGKRRCGDNFSVSLKLILCARDERRAEREETKWNLFLLAKLETIGKRLEGWEEGEGGRPTARPRNDGKSFILRCCRCCCCWKKMKKKKKKLKIDALKSFSSCCQHLLPMQTAGRPGGSPLSTNEREFLEKNMFKTFFSLLFPFLAISTPPQCARTATAGGFSSLLFLSSSSRQLFSRKREKNKKVCHDLLPACFFFFCFFSSSSSFFASFCSSRLALALGRRRRRPQPQQQQPRRRLRQQWRGKKLVLMNQNDIGRQHQQTYNFSPAPANHPATIQREKEKRRKK